MTTEVPLWVTITLGAIAIVGPIGGAWVGGYVTAKRDDRRWAEEHELQERRWRRDTDLEEAKYWRERRIRLYADLLGLWGELNERTGSYAAVRDLADRARLTEARDHLLAIAHRFQELAALAQVEASKSAVALCVKGGAHVWCSSRSPGRTRTSTPRRGNK